MILETPRLFLIPTPLDIVRRRLAHSTFTAPIETPAGRMDVRFPSEWPGDPLDMFPSFADWLEANPDAEQWGGIVILRDASLAVGQAGFKGGPDPAGRVELGYGINPSHWNRGIATEIVGALTAWARCRQDVASVGAETRTDNVASHRVLEKNGFDRVGYRNDPEDGPLIVWDASVAELQVRTGNP